MSEAPDRHIARILLDDPYRWRLLEIVRDLGLLDGWIGAGFIRNAVWDDAHDRAPAAPDGDVDVIWYDRSHSASDVDRDLESELSRIEPAVQWSVKNQARMHLRNGDDPYLSATDAMRFWPETATAVAARIGSDGTCEIAAPLGVEDLLGLILRPTTNFIELKRDVFDDRIATKGWLVKYPRLQAI